MNKLNTLKELLRYSRLLAEKDLVQASSGNVSLRQGEQMLIKASGISLQEVTSTDFIKVAIKNLEFKHKNLKPSCEVKLHAACYQSRPDISCVMHSHPLWATVLVSAGFKPCFFAPEYIISAGKGAGIVPYCCPGSVKLAQMIGDQAAKFNVIYLKNHGLVCLGKTVKEAFERTLLTEQMAKMQLIAKMSGRNLPQFSRREIDKLLVFAGK